MTLLELVQKVTGRTGIPVPTNAVTNSDKQIIQLLGLLEELLDELTSEPDWSPVTREATFAAVATESQGLMSALAPYGYKFILKDTFFNRTTQLPFYGPVTAAKWQVLKSTVSSGPQYSYRIVGKQLLLNPVPAAGDQCAFEYASSYAVLAADGTASKQYPTADDDTFLLDDTLVLVGLRWKWKYEKGLEYAEDFARFEAMKADLKGNDGSKPTLRLDGCGGDARPGIVVPPGNWGVP